MMSNGACAACGRAIDASARLCPYCGANPQTGERLVDTQALMQEVFQPRTLTKSESVLEYARQRQGVVIAISVFVAFLILGGLHQFATMRNASDVSDSLAVPLTEITDLTNKAEDTRPLPLPSLDFPYEGRPQVMRTFIVERGAITPPEVLAAQAAAQAARTPAQPQAQPQPQPLPQAAHPPRPR